MQFYDGEIEALGGRIYRRQRFNGFNYFVYIKYWNRFLEEHPEYQMVHGHIGSCAAVYLSAAKKHERITVAHSHSNGSKKKDLRTVLYFLFSYPTRYIADYFFGCSRLAGKNRYGNRVVKSSAFRVLNNGIDSEKFAFDSSVREKMKSQWNVSKDQLVVGHVGRFTYAKNHDLWSSGMA